MLPRPARVRRVWRSGLTVPVVAEGRPGPSLIELLDPSCPTVLTDVVIGPRAPGAIVVLPLTELLDTTRRCISVSSHGFGPAEALALSRALGRPLPHGTFVGVVGRKLRPGSGRSRPVDQAIRALADALRRAVRAL